MQTWVDWMPEQMAEATEREARAGFDGLAAPVRDLIETLPYSGAFNEFRRHVTRCSDCLRDDRKDCPRGRVLADTARVGVEEQHRIATNN
jgi:hypothetical protein